MRKTETAQLEIGGAFIEDLVIDPKSRDDIPALLLGLQHLHADRTLRSRLFALLESEVYPGVRSTRPRSLTDFALQQPENGVFWQTLNSWHKPTANIWIAGYLY